jgi:hypothetical protein
MTPDPHPDPHADSHADRWHDQDWRERADSDVTREFWGDGAGWSSQPADRSESVEDATPGGLGATLGRWWSSSRRRNATRTHAPAAPGASPDQADPGIAPTDEDHDDPATDWDDAWDTTPSEPPRSGVDPLLARLGGLAVVVTLLVPVVMGFTSDDGDAVRTASIAVDLPLSASGDQPADLSVAAASETADATTAPVSGATPSADPTVVVQPATTADETPNTAVVEALVVDECALDYEVASGDFWIRIADGSGSALADVLAVNGATVSTPLYPGRSICLPAGATIPPPPPAPTTAAPTTAAPTTSSGSTRSSSSSSTTSTASTTPTTTTPPPPPPLSTAGPAEVEAIIRSVWPDELEDRALEIAWRESHYVPTAKNSCCYGLFQIYWSAHRSWLSGLGVTSAEQLYDPATNARAALAIYERAGSWGPWGG